MRESPGDANFDRTNPISAGRRSGFSHCKDTIQKIRQLTEHPDQQGLRHQDPGKILLELIESKPEAMSATAAVLMNSLSSPIGTHLIPARIDHGVAGLARHPAHHQRHIGRVEEYRLASLRGAKATKQSRFPLWLRIASLRSRWRLPISPSRLHRALHARVERIERGRTANVESISLLTAEAQIGDGFRDVDLAEQIAVRRVAAHAVLVRITPTH